MSWMIKANINALESMLNAIQSGKTQISQVAYQLSPSHCELMNSMLMTHPHFTDVLNELIGAVCPQQPQRPEPAAGMDQLPESQAPENGDMT